jgi:hypothetical protein
VLSVGGVLRGSARSGRGLDMGCRPACRLFLGPWSWVVGEGRCSGAQRVRDEREAGECGGEVAGPVPVLGEAEVEAALAPGDAGGGV